MEATTSPLDSILQLAIATDERLTEYKDTKYKRDNAIRAAIKQGISMYAIGKHISLSDSAVASIRDK